MQRPLVGWQKTQLFLCLQCRYKEWSLYIASANLKWKVKVLGDHQELQKESSFLTMVTGLMRRESSSAHVRKPAARHQNQLAVQDLMKREFPVVRCKICTLYESVV